MLHVTKPTIMLYSSLVINASVRHPYLSPVLHLVSTKKELRALAGPKFLSMCRVFVSSSQPIRFVRCDGNFSESGISGVGPDQRLQFLVLTKRSLASGGENLKITLFWRQLHSFASKYNRFYIPCDHFIQDALYNRLLHSQQLQLVPLIMG